MQIDALSHGVSRANLLLNFAASAEEAAVIGQGLKGSVWTIYGRSDSGLEAQRP